MEIELIKKGFCPRCGCLISKMENNQVIANTLYTEFWVKYDDGTNANFAICKNCLPKLTLEEVISIHKRQKVTWGFEIINSPLSLIALTNELLWYIKTVSILDVVKFGKSKEEVSGD